MSLRWEMAHDRRERGWKNLKEGGRVGRGRTGTLGVGTVLKQMRQARPKRANLLMLSFVSIQFYITFYSACEWDTEHTHTLFVAYASSVYLYKQDLGGWWCKNSKKQNKTKQKNKLKKPLIYLGRSPRRERLPTPVFWPGEFHGLYSPWSRKESDTTEWLSLSLLTI